MDDKYTEREKEILNGWPAVTEEDLIRMNDLFPHYLFFCREGALMGLGGVKLYASCCGHKEYRPYLVRTEEPEHRDLLGHLKHRVEWTCPWCGRSVTVIDLARAKGRKSLVRYETTVLLHSRGEALYADALVLCKNYADEAALTALPTAWCSSGYRFVRGEVMQADHQVYYGDERPFISYEREKLSRRKLVQEPFKKGSISWYTYEPYSILNREALQNHPFFRYCGFFSQWQYRPMGARGYAFYFHDLISYLTVYAIYPRQVEMLAKSGYYQPLADMVYSRKKNAASMNWEETDPRRAFDLDKRELHWLLGVQPHMGVLAVRSYVKKHWGKVWSLPFCMDFFNLWGTRTEPMEVLRFLNRYHLDPDRFLQYLDGVFLQGEEYYATLFEVYRDYLEAAYQLGYCMEHGKVLWPDQLYTAHDVATRQLEAKMDETKTSGVALNGKARKEKYEFELDGLRIVFPLTSRAIKREGKALDHCVGGYAERHMKGVVTILFLRQVSQPGVPYVTIEMNGNKIQQIHGYHNDTLPGSNDPRVVHKVFLDTWLQWLRDGSKRNEDGTPKISGRLKRKEPTVKKETA